MLIHYKVCLNLKNWNICNWESKNGTATLTSITKRIYRLMIFHQEKNNDKITGVTPLFLPKISPLLFLWSKFCVLHHKYTTKMALGYKSQIVQNIPHFQLIATFTLVQREVALISKTTFCIYVYSLIVVIFWL